MSDFWWGFVSGTGFIIALWLILKIGGMYDREKEI